MYLQIVGTKAAIRYFASARIYVLSAIGQWSDKLAGAKRFDVVLLTLGKPSDGPRTVSRGAIQNAVWKKNNWLDI